MNPTQPEATELCQLIENYFDYSGIGGPLRTLSFLTNHLFEEGQKDEYDPAFIKDCHTQLVRLMELLPYLERENQKLIEKEKIPTKGYQSLNFLELYRGNTA